MIHEGSSRKRAAAKRDGHSETRGFAPPSAAVPVPFLHFPSTIFRMWSGLSSTAHVERPPLSYLLFGLEGGLEALPLCVSKTTTRDVRDRRDERDGPSGEDLWISNCAHQTTTSQFLSLSL